LLLLLLTLEKQPYSACRGNNPMNIRESKSGSKSKRRFEIH